MAHILVVAPRADRTGGTEVYTRQLVLGLAARGHAVSLLCHEADAEVCAVCAVHTVPRSHVDQLPVSWRFATLLRVFSYQRAVRSLAIAAPDVIIGGPDPLSWSAVQRWPGRPFLSVPHALIAVLEVAAYEWRTPLQRLTAVAVAYFLERWALNRADRTIRFSESACQALRAHYGRAVRPHFEVLPMAVALPEPRLAERCEAMPRLLFVGRLVPSKNVDFLLRTLADLRHLPWTLDVVGDGPQRAALEAQVERARLADRVIFHGQQDEVDRFYRRTDLFVFPSRLESLGIVLLEAMSHGVPTLTIRADGAVYRNTFHEIITDGSDGFVAQDETDFAAKLTWLLADAGSVAAAGASARATVALRHQWVQHLEGYERILDELQGPKAAAHAARNGVAPRWAGHARLAADVPEWSFVIPTYKRPDILTLSLQHLAQLDYPLDRIEVLVIDNGGANNTAACAEPFQGRLPLTYLVNDVNRGLGYSLQRGLRRCRGRKIVSMNDDALLPPSFLRDCDATFATDPAIGCIGCRVIERGYAKSSPGIGRIADSGEIVANFDEDCGDVIEVDHVYGFCYAFTREALDRAGAYDRVLLSKPYSSANRIETDHCLSIKRSGLKVVFNPRLVVEHLAKPRVDYVERSLIWYLNHTRNTLYLFLKHYGLLGRKCLALRFTFLQDVGIVSTLKKPNWANMSYFLMGLRARASAFGHYVRYLLGA